MSKPCSKCKEEKPLTEFVPRSDRKDGCGAECKICRNSRSRNAWARNPEHHREMQKKKSSREKHKVMSKNWRDANRVDINKKQQQYRKINPEMTKAMSQKFRDQLSDNYIKQLITRGTPLSPDDVPKSLIELHRINLKTKRKIKEIDR